MPPLGTAELTIHGVLVIRWVYPHPGERITIGFYLVIQWYVHLSMFTAYVSNRLLTVGVVNIVARTNAS